MAAGKARILLSKLLDAFVEMIGPAFARFVDAPRRVAVVEPDGLALYEVVKGRTAFLGRPGDGNDAALAERARGGELELRLPADQVLHRTLKLPEAGRAFVEQVIEHRLPRLTPWAPEKVLYGFRFSDRPEPDGQIGVAFAATSKDLAAASVDRLAALGLEPTALGSAAEPLDAPLGLDLYRGRRSAAPLRLRRAVALVAAGSALALVPACLGAAWFAFAEGERLRSAETRLLAARSALGARPGDRERAQDLALVAAKRPESSVLVLMDRLAAIVPTGTFLGELEIGPGDVRLVGHSTDAPALIGLLEADPALANVRFGAPVVRDSRERDGFEIVASRVAPDGGGSR